MWNSDTSFTHSLIKNISVTSELFILPSIDKTIDKKIILPDGWFRDWRGTVFDALSGNYRSRTLKAPLKNHSELNKGNCPVQVHHAESTIKALFIMSAQTFKVHKIKSTGNNYCSFGWKVFFMEIHFPSGIITLNTPL